MKLRLGAWWLGLGLFVLLWAIFLRRLDPDFGWHLQAGRYILAHGVPAHDVFTYTASSFPWVNHEWLSDVVTALLFDGAGFWLVAGVFAAVWAAAIVVAMKTGPLARVWAQGWPVGVLGLVAIAASAVARPNAWTALGLAALLLAVQRGVRWPIVGLFVVWANLHGGFVLGLGVLALAALRQRRYWPVLGAATAATLVNPYGPGLYVEIWRTLVDTRLRWQIGEWEPLQLGVLSGLYVAVFLFVVLAQRWRQAFALPALLLFAAVSSQRQFPLFVVASLGVVAEGYGAMVRLLNLERGWRAWVLPVAALGLALVPTGKIVADPGNDLPERGVAALRQRPCAGRLFNEYDFGGYVIWQLPGTQVYIDGRMPSWRMGGTDYLANWERVLDDAGFARSEFARYGVQCALLEKKHGRLIRQLVAEGWQVAAKDELAVLLRRD